jgi:hypothetical protein
MQRSTVTPEEYFETLSEQHRAAIVALDARISSEMTGLERVLWEGKFWGGTEQQIVGYGDYTQMNRSGNVVNWFIVGLAQQKNSISVYVNAVEDNQYLVEKFAARLGKVKTGKSTISIKRLEDVELDVLMEMIVKARTIMTANLNAE